MSEATVIKQIGRYEVLGELGQGAMGMVYQAKDPLIERVVAVKTIGLAVAQDERDEYEARFYQEAKAAGRLSHPNIVTIYDVGKSGDLAYIAMEFLEGRELREIMNDVGVLPVDQALDIIGQVAQGLAYAHQHGIIHRDIKPSNIMVNEDGHVKITDFGIARMSSSSVRTQVGMVLGSPKYMSPEQVLGKTLDQRTDIFSLGVTLYEMLTGRAPFYGDTVSAIMHQTLNNVPQPVKLFNPQVSDAVEALINKALTKKLPERYQSAKEFIADLRGCLGGGHSHHIPTPVSMPAKAGVREDVKGATTSGMSKKYDTSEATQKISNTANNVRKEEDSSDRTLKLSRQELNRLNKTPQSGDNPAMPKQPQAQAAVQQKTAQAQPSLFKQAEPDRVSKNPVAGLPEDKKKLVLIGVGVLVLLVIVFVLLK